MKIAIQNNHLDKMRSYSSVFSGSLFAKLLEQDDYSFLNLKIERYDLPKVGKQVITYYDYIRYIYSELRKQYRNEYIYKNTFINDLLLKKYGVKNTVVINEFRIGNSIADVVMFNGTSKAFEIKTELDSNKRLSSQLADYIKLFKECYVITHESLTSKYLLEDDQIGIIELVEQRQSVVLREVRPPKINKNIDPDTLIRTIRTNEYKNIVKQHYGELPEMNSFTMFEICRELIKQIPQDQLHNSFIAELKKRKTNTDIIDRFPTELRQVCLSMNASAISCQKLERKLKEKIKF